MEFSNAKGAARQAAEGRMASGFLERLAERIGGQASVRAVFGEPIERGELTIVPIARVRWGFGGGAGSAGETAADRGSGSGAGGGGGVAADPIGYLEIGSGGATFKPISQPYPGPLFLLASGLTAAIVLRALARLIGR